MSTQAGKGSGTTVVGNAKKQTWPYVSELDFSQTFETAGFSQARYADYGFIALDITPARKGFLICLRGTGSIVGVIHINSIIRGRFQNGSLSYAAFAPRAGQGYMSEGLGLVPRYAFGQLRLHRLDAQIQPGNHASLGCLAGPRTVGHHRDMILTAPAGPHPSLPER